MSLFYINFLQHKSNSKDKPINRCLLKGHFHLPGRYFCHEQIQFRKKKTHSQSTKMTRLFWESADVNNYHDELRLLHRQHNGSATITADTQPTRTTRRLNGQRKNWLLCQLQHTLWLGKRHWLRVPATRQHKDRRNYHNNINSARVSLPRRLTVWFAEKWEQWRKAAALASRTEFDENRSVSYCLSAG